MPPFILLRKQSKQIQKISTKSGFELEMNIPKDQSLVNDLVAIAVVEEANPAPDIYGNQCPLLPGDLVYADNCIFHESWQEGSEEEHLGFICRKSHIVAYERDGKVYSYPKISLITRKIRTDGTEEPPVDTFETTGLIKYEKGYYLAKRRQDIWDSPAFGLYSKYGKTHKFMQTDFRATTHSQCIFEVVSEEGKGKLVMFLSDWAIPYYVDPADLAEHGVKSVMAHEKLFGIEISEILAEVEIH